MILAKTGAPVAARSQSWRHRWDPDDAAWTSALAPFAPAPVPLAWPGGAGGAALAAGAVRWAVEGHSRGDLVGPAGQGAVDRDAEAGAAATAAAAAALPIEAAAAAVASAEADPEVA